MSNGIYSLTKSDSTSKVFSFGHLFRQQLNFQSHAAHRAIAAWALGADPGSIRSGYKKDCGYEKAAFKSPQPITNSNFEEHLGDDRYVLLQVSEIRSPKASFLTIN